MDRPDRPDFDVQLSANDSPWKTGGRAWKNVDGSIFIELDQLPDFRLMLVEAA